MFNFEIIRGNTRDHDCTSLLVNIALTYEHESTVSCHKGQSMMYCCCTAAVVPLLSCRGYRDCAAASEIPREVSVYVVLLRAQHPINCTSFAGM